MSGQTLLSNGHEWDRMHGPPVHPHVGSMALTLHPDEYTFSDWPSPVTAPGWLRSLIQYIENDSGPSWPNTYPSPELSLIISKRQHSPSMGRTHHIHGLIPDYIPPPIMSGGLPTTSSRPYPTQHVTQPRIHNTHLPSNPDVPGTGERSSPLS